MNAFIEYSWPGNVRELQNLVERAVIRSDDGVLPNPLPSPQTNPTPSIAPPSTFRDHETALILETLQSADGMIGGPRGAAARLGLKRTTLVSKMKRLGIYRTRSQRYTDVFQKHFESEPLFKPKVEGRFSRNQDLPGALV